MSGIFEQTSNIALLIFGFGFVIFWHELGHFIAAKWAGVKVDQFAVGFGHALVSWRKGLGFRWGSSGKEYEQMVQAAREGVQKRDLSHVGETEYRLNWIPLGGYVKMLGQDDMNPNATSEDPRAFNRKPISKRMVIVSAGVIMNVILAGIGFFVLFLVGFDVPPPVVGEVIPNSPAQRAGLRVGDRIEEFDGKIQRDFTKIQLNVALVKEGESVPIIVHRAGDPEGKTETLNITADRGDMDTTGFLQLGITPSEQLEGPAARRGVMQEIQDDKGLVPDDTYAVMPGEKVTAINGQPINPNDPNDLHSFWKLDQAVQSSNGKPVNLTVSDGKTTRQVQITPRFAYPFSGTTNFLGLVPRASVLRIIKTSDARGKLQPGDAVESVTVNTDTKRHPTREGLREILLNAGKQNQKVTIVVIRNGQRMEIKDLSTVKLEDGERGLGIQPDFDADSSVIGSVVPKSPADEAGISVTDSSDVVVTKLGDEPVKSFHDIKRILASSQPGKIAVTVTSDAGEKTLQIPLTAEEIQDAKNQTYRADVVLHELSIPRKTKNFVQAATWGVEETRDLIVQFYITLQRMFSGSVPAKNMMGPYGIVKAGAGFASRGMDYLIWFLAMISANLAVVNFLPIPIVDGGLFMFLIIEKFQGRPLSPKVQSIAQLVGIAMIVSVFIFVTYQDIMRH
jgi:regulator of sigma E protease